MSDLFISYATIDSQIAHRLYGDIIKLGGTAYLYEKKNDYVDFMEEIKLEIKKAKCFCLIDSPKARDFDGVVRKECKIALDYGFKQKCRFIVLKIAPEDKPWRVTEDEVFKTINTIRYADISSQSYDTDTDFRFDTGEKYYKCLNQLCKKIQINFDFPVPDFHDFMSELRALDLSGEEVETLTDDLKNILFKREKKYPKIRQRIQTLVSDCDFRAISTITPRLILGNYFLDNDLYENARRLFLKLIPLFNEDPRPHIGYMKAEYGLGNLKSAYNASIGSEQIILKKNGKTFSLFLTEIFYNKIKISILLNNLDIAKAHFQKLSSSFQNSYEFKTLELLIEVKSNNFKNKSALYFEIKNYYKNNILNKEEQYFLAELEYEIAQFYYRNPPLDLKKVIFHYDSAIKYDSENLMYYAEKLMIIYLNLYDKKQEFQIYKKFANHLPQTKNENYYLGLIKFLEGNTTLANKYYNKSIELGYEYYDKLIYQ